MRAFQFHFKLDKEVLPAAEAAVLSASCLMFLWAPLPPPPRFQRVSAGGDRPPPTQKNRAAAAAKTQSSPYERNVNPAVRSFTLKNEIIWKWAQGFGISGKCCRSVGCDRPTHLRHQDQRRAYHEAETAKENVFFPQSLPGERGEVAYTSFV